MIFRHKTWWGGRAGNVMIPRDQRGLEGRPTAIRERARGSSPLPRRFHEALAFDRIKGAPHHPEDLL